MELLKEIQTFNENLPTRVFAREVKNKKCFPFLKEKAIKSKYIAPYHKKNRNYIAIDIDHEEWYEATHDLGLMPNLVIKNKDNQKCHLLYKIEFIHFHKNKKKFERKYKEVSKKLSKALGADSNFNGQTIKNPNHSDWITTSYTQKAYSLDELDLIEPQNYLGYYIENPEGRNSSIFDSIRIYAYRIKGFHSNFKNFEYEVCELAYYLNNNLPKPLGNGEVKGIINSVVKWTWDVYTGRTTRGRDIKLIASCGCENDDTLSKQQLSAFATNQQRTSKMKEKIKDAVIKLLVDGKEITPKNVIKLSKVSRGSVYRELKAIAEPYIKFNKNIDILKSKGLHDPHVLAQEKEIREKVKKETVEKLKTATKIKILDPKSNLEIWKEGKEFDRWCDEFLKPENDI